MSTEEKPSPAKGPGCWPLILLVVGFATVQMIREPRTIGPMFLWLAVFAVLLAVFVVVMLAFAVVKTVRGSRNLYRQPVDPQVSLTSADDPDAAEEFTAVVERVAGALRPLGFSSPVYVRNQSVIGPVVVALMNNGRTKTIARLASTRGGNPVTRIMGPGFATGFVDDSQHYTMTLTEAQYRSSNFVQTKGSTRLILLDVDDPALLVRLHEEAVERRITGRRTPISWDPVELQREVVRRDCEARVRAGAISRDGDAYRMTYRGAFKTIFLMIPPFPQLRVRAARRNTAKALRELSA